MIREKAIPHPSGFNLKPEIKKSGFNLKLIDFQMLFYYTFATFSTGNRSEVYGKRSANFGNFSITVVNLWQKGKKQAKR
jgi:hypothetical protein